MPPKKVQTTVSEQVSQSQSSSKRQKKKFSKDFECACGKRYSSKHAVYTHIKEKHPEQERSSLRKQIYDPNAVKRVDSQIRMNDIDYHEVECNLLCLADLTLKGIFDTYTETLGFENAKGILLADDEESSDDSLELDEIFEQSQGQKSLKKHLSKRQRDINEKVKELRMKFKLDYLVKELNSWSLHSTFKLYLFKLNIFKDLTKYFKVNFAAYLELSLQLIHILKATNQLSQVSKNHFQRVLSKLWQQLPRIEGHLRSYYHQWTEKMPLSQLVESQIS